jgi:hypothetical protein
VLPLDSAAIRISDRTPDVTRTCSTSIFVASAPRGVVRNLSMP